MPWETRFLVVRADTLEPGVAAALLGLPSNLAAQVSAWLIATGGEAFGKTNGRGTWSLPVVSSS